jgi:hypothetical protein
MPNWTDNLLTVTGSTGRLNEFLAAVSGENGIIDFATHLPQAPVDDEGHAQSWWNFNACEAELTEHTPAKVVFYFQTGWEPPLAWAECVAEKYPDLRMSLLYAEEGEGYAGLWVSNESGTADNWLRADVVGYPTVWAFLDSLGCDFGWNEPDDEPYDPDLVPQVG